MRRYFLSTYNLFFGLEIRKLYFIYTLLSGGLLSPVESFYTYFLDKSTPILEVSLNFNVYFPLKFLILMHYLQNRCHMMYVLFAKIPLIVVINYFWLLLYLNFLKLIFKKMQIAIIFWFIPSQVILKTLRSAVA